jgi:hypothetical protein
MDSVQINDKTVIVEPKRSHNVKGTKIFKELDKNLVYEIYEYMDWLWNTSGFIPCPIKLISDKFKITATHVTYIMLAWRESRMKREIYGNLHTESAPTDAVEA